MKVFFIKMKKKNEKKKYFLKDKESTIESRNNEESVLPRFFKQCLIILYHPVQYGFSL